MLKHFMWILVLACVSGMAADEPEGSNTKIDMDELTTLLSQYRDSHDGQLPDSFRVHIHLNGYSKFGQPSDIYEFTTTEVLRLKHRMTLDEKNGREILAYDEAQHAYVYDVVQREPFKKIDSVCRALLALDYPDLVKGMTAAHTVPQRNLEHLSVMSGAGLPAAGNCEISISFDGKSCEYHESCWYGNSATSAQSIRFGALFYTLRNLARGTLGLALNQWKDAIWKEAPLNLKKAK